VVRATAALVRDLLNRELGSALLSRRLRMSPRQSQTPPRIIALADGAGKGVGAGGQAAPGGASTNFGTASV
jgi:hypothetical protein